MGAKAWLARNGGGSGPTAIVGPKNTSTNTFRTSRHILDPGVSYLVGESQRCHLVEHTLGGGADEVTPRSGGNTPGWFGAQDPDQSNLATSEAPPMQVAHRPAGASPDIGGAMPFQSRDPESERGQSKSRHGLRSALTAKSHDSKKIFRSSRHISWCAVSYLVGELLGVTSCEHTLGGVVPTR